MSESDESNMPPFIGLARPLSEVPPQKPDWDAASEAMRRLDDIEAMQGGKNGPTIKLRAAIDAMQKDADDAKAYALRLAISMHKQHYLGEAPDWIPFTDITGLLTQIDNMYAGLRNDFEASQVENKRLVGFSLAWLRAENKELRKAWETAKRQNSHDMLLSGDEIHQHDAAIDAARLK